MTYGILVDTTKCTGCEKCVEACVAAHELSPLAAARDGAVTKDGLSANRWVTLLPLGSGQFARKSCMHCLEPSCVSACLVGGLTKSPEGPVIYDPARCIGCRYCMLACPFHIPRYEWSSTAPLVKKCDMCIERIRQGQRPACVEACPNDALAFGPREVLLERAQTLVRDEPDRYLDRVWGELEWGGTSVLYVSGTDLSAAGWPPAPVASIPSLTEPLISKTPAIGFSVGLGLLALSAIINRRNKVMAEEREARRARKRENGKDNTAPRATERDSD